MNKTVSICVVVAWVVIWMTITVAAPWMLSDHNKFFAGFVNHEFLTFMGVVVTITLSSASNLFIELNKLDEKLRTAAFARSKREIRHSAYFLIATLIAAIVLVIVKPLVICGERSEAIVNGTAVAILLAAVLVLIDLTKAGFSLDIWGE